MSEPLPIGTRVRYVGPDTEWIKKGDTGIYRGAAMLPGMLLVEICGHNWAFAPEAIERLPTSPACPDCDALRAESARLRDKLATVRKAASDCLAELPDLPCRVDEMTDREAAIYDLIAAPIGTLQFVQDWLHGDDAEPSVVTAEISRLKDESARLRAANEGLEKALRACANRLDIRDMSDHARQVYAALAAAGRAGSGEKDETSETKGA
jgi:hypothetical protein